MITKKSWRLKTKLLLMSGALFWGGFLNNSMSQIEKHEAAYIFNFAQLIEWPENHKQGEFIIGILGENQKLADELQQATANRTVGGRDIIVEKFKTVGDLKYCHILFVPDRQANNLKQAVAQLGSTPTIIVTENSSRIPPESTINLRLENQKLTFYINKKNPTIKKFVISEKLLALAKG